MSLSLTVVLGLCSLGGSGEVRWPGAARNLLVEAKVSGNLMSQKLGRRGEVDHVIFDIREGRFVKRSQWHEWGVGFGKDLGVVPESKPAWWLAEWSRPVTARMIVLSGAYPNQPQPKTGWKIEVRRGGRWTTHARGVGGWYDNGRYVWDGRRKGESLTMDAFRVSVFSGDGRTPIKSIHFRGEPGVSWVVAEVPPIDARVVWPAGVVRAGVPVRLAAETTAGKLTSWSWRFGVGGAGGATAAGPAVTHTFGAVGEQVVELVISDGTHTATVRETVRVASPVAARIRPLTEAVLAGAAATFADGGSVGKVTSWRWDFGDGGSGAGRQVRHAYARPGVYRVRLTVGDGRYEGVGEAIVRVHGPATVHVPQVHLDTDQKNEQDDQHYFAYGLFSELDIVGVNSVHHGGGQEPANYGEILHVLKLARASGLPKSRVPLIFRGANERLRVPASGRWQDTEPIVTAASGGILAAARGASPSNRVWVVPVGPGTNVASAILEARREGLELAGRLRVMWLGGSNGGIAGEFNGNNDPWSMYVVCRSGIETWIMPAPVGARVRVDKRTEPDVYAKHPLGQYLLKIVPARDKPLFDASCLSAILSLRLGTGWVRQSEFVTVSGGESGYRWSRSAKPTSVRVIRQIDPGAMKRDLFETIQGRATRLIGARPAER